MRGAGPPPAQLLETLKRGFMARLMPLIAEMQAASEAELRRRLAEEQASNRPGTDRIGDQLTNLAILRRDASRYERRWQDRIGDRFAGWPRRVAQVARSDGYALVSDDELQAQLIGQPVVEALERRFVDVLNTIDSRLWSLAADLGGEARPANPFAPRALIDGLLDTLPIAECDPELRQAMLRHYERLCGDRLGEVYAWINTQLSDAGHAMSGANDYAMLVAQPASGAREGVGRTALWSNDNALSPRESSWRKDRDASGAPRDAARGNALRSQMRAARAVGNAAASGIDASSRREFSDKEFLSVLSLLQGDETPVQAIAIAGDVGPHLRESLVQGASSLGMSSDTSAPSAAQDDAIDLVGSLFDGLRERCTLSPAADARLVRLAWPYLRLSLDDPYLFDDPEHPAMLLLSDVVALWDGNAGTGEYDAELHALADEVADAVANDYHGNTLAFDRALNTLEARLEPLRKRADIAARRAGQTIFGRERLHAARTAADALLARRLDGRVLLPAVAEFLGDQWRQALVHAWLREGAESERFRDAIAVGDAIIGVDEDAALAHGHAVAEGLIALEQPLRNCYVACGLDESGANSLLAVLVSELAQPDAKRAPPEFTPLAGEHAQPDAHHGAVDAGPALEVGQIVLRQTPGDAVQWLRVAWISPISGQHLLVNRQGARHAVLSSAEIAAGIANGELSPRSMLAPVEAMLQDLFEAGADPERAI